MDIHFWADGQFTANGENQELLQQSSSYLAYMLAVDPRNHALKVPSFLYQLQREIRLSHLCYRQLSLGIFVCIDRSISDTNE